MRASSDRAQRMVRRIGVVTTAGLVIVACASSPSRTPAGGPVSCHDDGDCTVTDFGGCCACCKAEPRALPVVELQRQQQLCAAASCAACDPNIQCPSVTKRAADFVAKCKDGTCAAVPR